jgi:ankyrin repeat protein
MTESTKWPPAKFAHRLAGRPFLEAREGADFAEIDLDRALQALGVYPERGRAFATRLITACVERREKDALLLAADGANLNLVVANGWTPLAVACAHGLAKIAEVICCAKGVRLDAATGNGDTALTFACARGMQGIVALLCLRGADVNAMTRAGRTPLDIARQQGLAVAERAILAKGGISGVELRARIAAAAERQAKKDAAEAAYQEAVAAREKYLAEVAAEAAAEAATAEAALPEEGC